MAAAQVQILDRKLFFCPGVICASASVWKLNYCAYVHPLVAGCSSNLSLSSPPPGVCKKSCLVRSKGVWGEHFICNDNCPMQDTWPERHMGTNHCHVLPAGLCPADSCPGNGLSGQVVCTPGASSPCGDLQCQLAISPCTTNSNKCIGKAVCPGVCGRVGSFGVASLWPQAGCNVQGCESGDLHSKGQLNTGRYRLGGWGGNQTTHNSKREH